MNQIEALKTKIQKLVNQFNYGNYKLVIQEVNILLRKLPNNSFLPIYLVLVIKNLVITKLQLKIFYKYCQQNQKI